MKNKQVILIMLCIFIPIFTFAHRYHFTISEAEWNAKSNRLEVALRVDSFELEDTLSKLTNHKIDLDKTKNVDKYIMAYLKKRFIVKNTKNELCAINWVGKEVAQSQMWLYFEVIMPDGLSGAKFCNRIFFDSVTFEANTLHTPINIMNFRYGKKKKSLYFSKHKADEIVAFVK